MKECKKCGVLKELTAFYTHPKTKDGRLGKCIDCCKLEAKELEKEKRKSPEFVEKEKKRLREKYHRLNYSSKPVNKEKRLAKDRAYKNKFPEKASAHTATKRDKPIFEGNQLHHWSYKKEHWKDFIELRPPLHFLAHRFLNYDDKIFMFKSESGELLDTKEKHYNYLLQIFRANIN